MNIYSSQKTYFYVDNNKSKFTLNKKISIWYWTEIISRNTQKCIAYTYTTPSTPFPLLSTPPNTQWLRKTYHSTSSEVEISFFFIFLYSPSQTIYGGMQHIDIIDKVKVYVKSSRDNHTATIAKPSPKSL